VFSGSGGWTGGFLEVDGFKLSVAFSLYGVALTFPFLVTYDLTPLFYSPFCGPVLGGP
jgi:hypothetical protein